jgi:hypothetical protein
MRANKKKEGIKGRRHFESAADYMCTSFLLFALRLVVVLHGAWTQKSATHTGTQNWQVAPNACRFASSAKLFSPAGFSAAACAVKCIFKDGRRVSPLSNRRLACRRKNRPAVDDKSLVSFNSSQVSHISRTAE